MRKNHRACILSIYPWSANGPGWANSGVTIKWRSSTGETWEETLYPTDPEDAVRLGRDAVTLLPHAINVVGALQKAIEANVARRRSPAGAGEVSK